MTIFGWLSGRERSDPAGDGPRRGRVTALVDLEACRADAGAFCLAVCEASARRRAYGVRLLAEPDDGRYRGMVAVDGFVAGRIWRIGHLRPEAAGEIHRLEIHRLEIHRLSVAPGAPVEAALHSIRIGDRRRLEIRIVLPVAQAGDTAGAPAGR